jgi:ABC-2 type transport system permease protein
MINKNVFAIAQKEAADHLRNTGFLVLLAVYTAIVFSSTYVYGSLSTEGSSALLSRMNIEMIARFIPLVGIVLGFDVVIRERRSGSMNVLLTHPLFRDYVIAGKMLGAMLVLAAIVIFSVFVSIGALLIFYGFSVEYAELGRLVLLIVLTFLYGSIFLEAAVLISTLAGTSTNSLTINVVIWLFICILYGVIIQAFVSLLPFSSLSGDVVVMQLLDLSPIHHYAEATMGVADFSFGGINSDPVIRGILDIEYTLYQSFAEFWMNIAVLIVTPIILFVAAFIEFLRKDITL